MWKNVKPNHWQKYKDCWWIFLALNILTVPLSPMGGGVMSRDAYMPIMCVKLSIVALLLLVGLYMKISSKLYRT